MSKTLETLNNELFNSFNPQDEPWVVGGGFTGTGSHGTHGPSGPDPGGDVDIDADMF